VTPGEVALAKILAAWDAYPGWRAHDQITPEHWPLVDVGRVLVAHELVDDDDQPTTAGRDLLDRARAAGVLPLDACPICAASRAVHEDEIADEERAP
jgi:hypothetical protein